MKSILKTAFVLVVATSFVTAPRPGFAQANQNYPSKPIRLVTTSAGSQSDMLTRMIGAKMSESWGQPVIVENRTGAGGAIAASVVAKAAPDGYTLLNQSAQFAIGAALHASLPYDPIRDFAGITRIGFSTTALVVAPSLGVKSVKDFIALAMGKPGQIFFSSAGAGSGMHMNGERFRLFAGIKGMHVGFKGASEALVEVMAGRIHYSVPGLGPALPLIKDGKLVALAVIAPERSPLLPDVPAMVEALPGYETDGSFGLLAPARTPSPVLNQISKEVRRILDLPDVKARLGATGFTVAPTTPEEHGRILHADIETFAKVVKSAGLRVQ